MVNVPQNPDPAGRPLRVLLCPDQPDWAFDNIARNIRRYAPAHLSIAIHYMGRPGTRDLAQIYERIVVENIDVLHLFWREDLFALLRPETLIDAAGKLGVTPPDIVDMIGGCALTTSVYDHLHLSEDALAERSSVYHQIDGYSVCSKRLHDIYVSLPGIPDPDALITDGVDVDHFTPGGAGARREPGQAIRIGWVGNSRWGESVGGDPKGFHRLLQPAIAVLKDRGWQVELALADPQVKRIPFAEMPQFYRSIDLLACTSAAEGTPNPVLEAMAMGLPVVSTDVGIVPEVFGPRQSAFIVRDHDPASFADAIEKLNKHPETAAQIGQENRQAVMAWSWRDVTAPWWPFWQMAHRRCTEERLAARRRESLKQACTAHANYLAATSKRENAVTRLLDRLKQDGG
ncbi:glycosyltransferase family 4 protein [Hoeflea poritis]|uniref:Glycosyltransferase family 4 protein n=1 Tax=Hoeflea poritis TaxID=2993659 RepID=A0ABT4VQQ0_9HYPH|nr:glycosyltransferase family 4 protein [Hoeflea poritis]MDA4847038.1 glycosyltransferase family 4 protein [Hoeflea poritis]